MTSNKKLTHFLKKTIFICAVIFGLFQILVVLKPMDSLSLRSIHLGFVLILVLLGKCLGEDENRSVPRVVSNLFFMILGLLGCIYLYHNAYDLMTFRMGIYTREDLIFGIFIIVSVIFTTWKMYGYPIVIIIAFALAYLVFGQHCPEFLAHPGITYQRMISNLSLYTEGIFGSALGASATVVAAFMIFAGFIQESGGANLFMDLSVAIFGRFTGGPAKIAIVASSLFGMISGSAAANVAGTGVITIPMMKEAGFEPDVAAAVEASASSGGQLMPPIMGAAAFIIAELLGVSYVSVIKAAIIPAIIYYVAIFMSVHFYSKRKHILPSKTKKEDVKKLILTRGHTLLPLILLVVLIGFFQMTAQLSALIATISVIVCSFFRKETRFTLKKFIHSLHSGAMAILDVSVICAAAGIILGVFNVTGLGLKLSSALLILAGDSLFILLLLSMATSLILGMGLPTVAAYLILAILVVPAMVDFGTNPLAAHMFVFYFGIISAITPPVAIAAYVGAGIAGGSPMKTGWEACKLALPVFVIPFIFVYQPALLLIGTPLGIFEVVFTTLVGSLLCAAAMQGYFIVELSTIRRVLLLIAMCLLMVPERITDLSGLLLAMIVMAEVIWRKKKTSIHAPKL